MCNLCVDTYSQTPGTFSSFLQKILLSQPHMTYFSPLRRLSPTVKFIHHPNLHLFSDHRKSLELFEKYFSIQIHSNTIHLHSKNPRKAQKILGKILLSKFLLNLLLQISKALVYFQKLIFYSEKNFPSLSAQSAQRPAGAAATHLLFLPAAPPLPTGPQPLGRPSSRSRPSRPRVSGGLPDCRLPFEKA
jgi:hypothetical protein